MGRRALKSGKEVMQLLLEHGGADLQITSQVVEAAARNWINGGR
jgi:hypothetical protein